MDGLSEMHLNAVLHRLEQQGASVEQYLQATGMTQDQLIADVRLESTKAVKADLATALDDLLPLLSPGPLRPGATWRRPGLEIVGLDHQRRAA